MLADALAAIEGGRWAEYGKARKPVTKNQLAQLLKGLQDQTGDGVDRYEVTQGLLPAPVQGRVGALPCRQGGF